MFYCVQVALPGLAPSLKEIPFSSKESRDRFIKDLEDVGLTFIPARKKTS